MNPERWEQIQALFEEVDGRPEEERRSLLDERCAGDPDLRAEVQSLLDASTEAGEYFDDLSDRVMNPSGQGNEPTSLVGRRLAHFELVSKLGQGGMGEVYQATDSQLGRDVALKILPERLLADPQQVARFKREAQLLATLNHPSIAAIYGLRESDGHHFLVLELVDGPTLDTLIAGGTLPRDEALEIAREVACALEAAHAHGIVHRDLKPANIKLTEKGKVKVLDFGIAKVTHKDTGPGQSRTPSTDEMLASTLTGQVIGTVSYMSPEQLKGKFVDTRSDVWGFGVLLFQLLAGSKPFQSDGFAVTLAKVLGHDPDWPALPQDLDPRLLRLIERCLERDVARRLQAIGEARIVIEDVLAGRPMTVISSGDEGRQGQAVSSRRRWSGALAGLAGAAMLVVAAFAWGAKPEPPRPVDRFVSPLRAGQTPALFGVASFNLSSDGALFVYRGPGENGAGNRLWVRRWQDVDAVPLRGTEGGIAPSVSDDGREIALSQDGMIKVVSVSGGPIRTLAEGINPTWGYDDFIYMTVTTGTARISRGGGEVEMVSERGEGDGNHFIIDHLPDGRSALISVDRLRDSPEIRVVDLQSGDMTGLTEGTWPRYSETGHLVFLLGGSLMAARFDAGAGTLLGPPVPLIQGVLSYALSDDGSLAYSVGAGAVGSRSELVWVDRAGETSPVEDGWYFDRGGANPGWSLSPDGSRIALRIGGASGSDIWVKEIARGALSRLTFYEGEDRKPSWSSDGRSVTFLSDRGGDLDVWSRRADGSGEAEVVLDHTDRIADAAWSPTGEWLVVRTAGTQDLAGGRDVLAVRPEAGKEVVPLLVGDYDESGPALSPDGEWIAYSSTETGRNEVFVRPFPDVDAGRWQITTQGGSAPQWAHNGSELFYVDQARRLMSVTLDFEPRLRVAETEVLFAIPPGFDLAQVSALYDVAPDDSRFLMARVYRGEEDRAGPEVILVRNWHTELEQRASR